LTSMMYEILMQKRKKTHLNSKKYEKKRYKE